MKERLNEHQEAVAHRAIMEKLWTRPLVAAYLERFPSSGGATVLVAEARCGYVPLRWAEQLGEDTRIIALDPSRSMLDQARQRVDEELGRRVFFVPQRVSSLSYADGVFKGAVCMNGVATALQLRAGLEELSRVVEPGGELLVITPTAGCFPQLYDLFEEALHAHDIRDAIDRLHDLKGAFIWESHLYERAMEQGLREVRLERSSWDVAFESGREALMSPMLRETFFSHWLGAIRSSDREPVLRYVADAIDTYFHGRVFICTVEAACLMCRR